MSKRQLSLASPQKINGYESVEMEDPSKAKTLSPLLQAAKNGDLTALTLRLEKGDDLLQLGEGKSTALHYVCYAENFDNAINCAEVVIAAAKRNSNSALLLNLLNAENLSKRTALGNATLRGNTLLMELLLEYGTSLNVTAANETLFHILAKSKNTEAALPSAKLLLNLKYYNNDLAKLRNYLNVEDAYTKRTALHFAGIFGNPELIAELIQNGADATMEDYVNCNIFHHAVGNAFEEKAVACTQVLLQDLIPEWTKLVPRLLESTDASGRCPVHIGARRGYSGILALLPDYYSISEAGTGLTPLHCAASLGDEDEAEVCVKEILSHGDDSRRELLCNIQDAEGRTALYLSAKERNVEACKALLTAGSRFDIPTKRGTTPLEKVYEKIPQVVSVLLNESIKNSGYVAYFRTIKTMAEIDFGPILGKSSRKCNVFKETEELVKVCKAKFADRKTLLYHPFVRIYIHEKWEKVKWIFHIFRILHIMWFFFNCIFVVYTYRYICPLPGARDFTWQELRQKADAEVELSSNKTLSECEITSGLETTGVINLLTLFLYILCQLHNTKQNFHQIFRPAKIKSQTWIVATFTSIVYTVYLFVSILPLGAIVIGLGILFATLPTIGVQPFSDFYHYFVAGMVALGVWAAICLEAMKIPRFSFYKNLLWRSARTLLVAITVTAPILFGFAALFAILVPGERAFSSPAQSLVKVITFMIGELDYGSLVYGETESVFLGWVMLFMALFIVIIVVLLVNFLIGLAAEEISDVWDRAVVWNLCTKLEEIYALESLLDENIPICGRGFLRKRLMLMPPETEDGQVVRQVRKARIKIPSLPKELQKEFHQLRLKTIVEVKQL